jgi:hypothetical protein
MLRNQVRFFTLLALLAATEVVAFAQLTAELTGAIRDASGATIPAAAVTVVNEGTGIKWEAKANQDGIYIVRFSNPACIASACKRRAFAL